MPLVSVFGGNIHPWDYHLDYGCWGTVELTEGKETTLYSQYDFMYESKIISIDWTATFPESNYVTIKTQDRYSCTVKGEEAGYEAKVWCLAKYGGGSYRAYYLVKVKKAPPAPTSITVSPSTINITVGNTQKASYSLSPSNASTTVTWSSDDASIASVGTYTGEVKGVGVGTTRIWAKTSNGKKDYCTITVGPEVGIQINKENFPDEDFRQYLTNRFGEILSDGEIESTTSITINNIWNLRITGIEYFKNLKELNCNGSRVLSLDLSKNTTLEKLSLKGCCLSSLDVSNNKSLIYLDCSLNYIHGNDMHNLINSLPINTEGYHDFIVTDYSEFENNVCTTSQAAWAKRKGWLPFRRRGDWLESYDGSEPEKGDLNEDGEIDGSDIWGLKKYIWGDTYLIDSQKADVNDDKKVNVADIVEIIRIIKAKK